MNQVSYDTADRVVGKFSRFIELMMYVFLLLMGIGLFLLVIFFLYLSIVDGQPALWFALIFSLIVMAISVGMIGYDWGLFSSGFAHYRFEENGLWVQYPFRKPILIPWGDFQQVCVIYAAYTTRGEKRANTVLCCVKKGEKVNGRRRWKTDNPFRYRSVITIDYTPELHQGLIERCTQEVVDLRDTMTYSLKYW